MYTTIVVGTDGSKSARVAVHHAAYLASCAGARLHLVTAVSATPIGVGPDMVHALPPTWVDANVDAARETLEAAEFEALFADMPEPRNEPGGSPTPKLATPLAGLSKPQEDEPPATGETPEPSPQPA